MSALTNDPRKLHSAPGEMEDSAFVLWHDQGILLFEQGKVGLAQTTFVKVVYELTLPAGIEISSRSDDEELTEERKLSGEVEIGFLSRYQIGGPELMLGIYRIFFDEQGKIESARIWC